MECGVYIVWYHTDFSLIQHNALNPEWHFFSFCFAALKIMSAKEILNFQSVLLTDLIEAFGNLYQNQLNFI